MYPGEDWLNLIPSCLLLSIDILIQLPSGSKAKRYVVELEQTIAPFVLEALTNWIHEKIK